MKRLIKKALRSLFGSSTNSEEREFRALHAEERHLISAIREKRLTYLTPRKLASIVATLREAETANLRGAFLEAGCALGGSTILISKVKRPDRELRVYDVFGMIPPPTDQDGTDVKERYAVIESGGSVGIGGDQYYGYRDDLYEQVRANLSEFSIDEAKHHVKLIRGLVQDTLTVDAPVAFAHIDVDWYEPVKTCLERIVPRLVLGGSIILDDYNDWSGCRKATDEYFGDKWNDFRRDDSAGSMKLTRTAPASNS